jgi:hypothetical protein
LSDGTLGGSIARGAGVEENQRVAAAAGYAVERHDDALADALATQRGIAEERLQIGAMARVSARQPAAATGLLVITTPTRSAINARRRDA